VMVPAGEVSRVLAESTGLHHQSYCTLRKHSDPTMLAPR
jgi:hypothetical protein